MDQTGELDAKTRALIRLGAALGAGETGAIHWYIRMASEAGATQSEIRQAINSVVPIVGLSSNAKVLTWVRQVSVTPLPTYFVFPNGAGFSA